jgi:septal ring factor EnvC (AmiA/AmiB activator)
MKRLFVGLTLCTCLAISLLAQTNGVIKELENRHTALQKQIRESETLLRSTKNDVIGQLNSLNTLTGQIAERIRYIRQINYDMETINRQLNAMERELTRLEKNLNDKKKKYEASVQYLHQNRTVEEKLLFIFSAQTLAQTYRRLRYVNEYATYQRLQGKEIQEKQQVVKKKREELQAAKKVKEKLLKEREEERKRLETEERMKKNLLAALQKKQTTLQSEVDKKRREANKLNARIDQLIAEEIEKSRKAAEADARRSGKAAGSKIKSSAGIFSLSKADRELSGSFVNNRGKLPVPVTGTYMIVNRYGRYNVQGLHNVKLDNKGIDIQGRPGAQARTIFDGEVTSVFEVSGLSNVLVRHGNYISVYCNLSSVSVKKGAKVKTGQNLGTIFSNKTDNNRTILHFQLRKEREQLNPEPWLGR